MKNVTIRYGLQTVPMDFPDNFNVGQIVRDPRVRAQLGYGDNITVMEDGVNLPLDTHVSDGTELTVETAANRKAIPSREPRAGNFIGSGYFVPLGVPQHV